MSLVARPVRRARVCGLTVCSLSVFGATWAQSEQPAPYPDTVAVESQERARETGDASVLQLDELVIRGEQLDRTQTDAASSVQVVSREEIESASMDDVYDAIGRTANVNLDFADLGRVGGFSIRGISNTGVSDQSFSSSTPLASIYVDGVPLSVSGARGGPLELWDVESVEFLRGPQSTQQGQGALAGAIVVNTRDPEDDTNLRARVRRGSDDYEQQAVAVGGPLFGRFGVRIAAVSETADGAARNITRDEPADFYERHNLRAKLGWLPREPGDGSAVLNFTRSDNLFRQSQLVGNPEDRQTLANDPEQVDTTTDVASLRAGLPISRHWSIEAVTGRAETDLLQQDDYNASAEDDGIIINRFSDETFTQELRLNFQGLEWLGGPLRGVIGVYTSRLDGDSGLDVVDGNVLNAGPLSVYLDTQVEVDQQRQGYAFFGDLEWTVRPRWTLLAGLRVDRESLDYRYSSNNDLAFTRDGPPLTADVIGDLFGPAVGLPEDGEGDGSSDSDALLPKLGLRYNWSESSAVGLTVQRAYRAGGLSVNFVRGTFNTFDPEYTLTTELFARTALFDRRLRLRANLFYTDWTDQQVSVQLSDDVNDTQTENAGESRLYGAELEVDARILWNLDGFVSMGYSRTEFLDFQSSAGDYTGNEFPSAPQRTGALGLRYGGPALGPYAQLDLTYVDEQFRQADNNPEQRSDAYALLNGRIGWRVQSLELYIAGRNLLDRFYLTQRAFDRFRAGDPRTVFAGIDLQFE